MCSVIKADSLIRVLTARVPERRGRHCVLNRTTQVTDRIDIKNHCFTSIPGELAPFTLQSLAGRMLMFN